MINMTDGKPFRLIIGFAVPILMGSIFQQIYNFADAIIVGRFLGEEALAGIGCTGSLSFFLLSLILGLSNGTGVIVAQYYGATHYTDMKRAVTAIIWVAGIFTLCISIIGVVGNRFFLSVLSVPNTVALYAAEYLHIIYLFITGTVAFNVCSAILRSLGDSKTPLFALLIASVLNVALDVLFISRFGLGVTGAAAATVIAQFVSAMYCLCWLVYRRKRLHLDFLPKRPDRQMILLIFKIGVPTAFQSSLIAIGNMSVQRLINSFGAAVMAAYAAAGKIDGIAIQVIVSLGTALSVFTGQNLGQKNFDRIQKGLYCTLALSVVSALCIASVAFWKGQSLMSLFLDIKKSGEAITIGATYLSIMGVAYVVCGIMQSYLNLIRGAGDSNTCLIAGISELLGRVFFAYVLSSVMGINGIWFATPLSWMCGCIVPVVRYYSGTWKKKILV